MENKSLADQLKDHWQRVSSPEALALAEGLRSMSSIPKVTILPTLPVDGRVVIYEDVFVLPMAESAPINDQPE